MRQPPEFSSDSLADWSTLPRKEDDSIDWQAAFGRERPLRLEIGVGNSPFLIDVAEFDPEFNYIGVEVLGKRVKKFVSKVDASGLKNIRMLKVDADKIVHGGMGEGELDHLFVNFPDPWPKRRHAKNRFVQSKNIDRVVKLLRPGGRISLRTDDPNYAAQMLQTCEGALALENLAGKGEYAPSATYPFPTQFEIRFVAQGLRIYYLEYRKSV